MATTRAELRLVRIEVVGQSDRYVIESANVSAKGAVGPWREVESCSTRNAALAALQGKVSDGSVLEVRTVEIQMGVVRRA